MLFGKILAYCGMLENKNITWIPSYGAEVRGGTAYSMTIISDQPIPSPIVTQPDTCVVMNSPSFERFKDRLKKDGLLIVNSSLVKNISQVRYVRLLKLPFSEIATKLGNIRVANMIIMGAYIKKKKIVSFKSALRALDVFIRDKRLLGLNRIAISEGIRLVR